MPVTARQSNSEDGWTFLTNHSHVLICLARDPDLRLRDLADAVGITERAVQGIVSDLEAAGFITKRREGRRNHYSIVRGGSMRHQVEAGHTVGELLDAMAQTESGRSSGG
ncbi:MAG: helix-turn-helix domain-containing protein [Acidimicrobiia bacterium]|nr:helix-turn-helix domain-containing protein [Acidimicrobiia bacterium]